MSLIVERYTVLPPVTWHQINYERFDNKNYLRRYYAVRYNPNHSKRKRRSVSTYDANNGVVVFVAGDQKGCEAVTAQTAFCNGPLRPGQQYR